MNRFLKAVFFAVLILLSLDVVARLALFLMGTDGAHSGAFKSDQFLSETQKNALRKLLRMEAEYLEFCPDLGWTIRPHGCRGQYSANSRGLRGESEHASHPTGELIRVACFGDSFTHCDGVKDDDTWQAYLSRERPLLEVLNFGVSAYGLDQSFLRYLREGVSRRPHIVLIGFMSENIGRTVNVFRPFYVRETQVPMTKPRYTIANGQLVLHENPVRELSQYAQLIENPAAVLPALGVHDAFYETFSREGASHTLATHRLLDLVVRRCTDRDTAGRDSWYRETSEAFRVTTAIFDAFVTTVRQNGTIPIVVVFPDGADLRAHRTGGPVCYAPLLEHVERRQYRHIDVLGGFDRYAADVPVRELIPLHYSARGNAIVARCISEYLEKNDLLGHDVAGALARPLHP